MAEGNDTNTVSEQVRAIVTEMQTQFAQELRTAVAEAVKQTREEVLGEVQEKKLTVYDRIKADREAAASEGKNRVSGADRLMGGAK